MTNDESADIEAIHHAFQRVLNAIVRIEPIARLEVQRDAARRLTEMAITIRQLEALREVLEDETVRELCIIVEIPDKDVGDARLAR